MWERRRVILKLRQCRPYKRTRSRAAERHIQATVACVQQTPTMAAATATLSPPRATPPTYHRIVSTTLKVPTDPLQPVPVGLLACQRKVPP